MVDSLNCAQGDGWIAYHGDCVRILRQLPDNCVHHSVFSPPFSGLYIYSNSVADMGNCASDEEFFDGYKFFAEELTRVLKPGRCINVHCKDLVYYKNQRGTAGLRDFPGDLIRAHTEAGLDYHSRVTIERCPVREMTKTKAHGLLYKQLRADSTFSRQGLPEYILTFRKWAKDGDDIEPVTHTHDDFPLDQWQRIANSVWKDTRETNVLASQKEAEDEKHICPLPLDIITNCLRLYSNPGDVVLSPFMGIGSEGYCAVKMGRKFVGTELKEGYWSQAVKTLTSLESQPSLFSLAS